MKRGLALFLTVILCVSLSACGKSQEARAVEEKITAIGEVTLDSQRAIEEAQQAYEALTAEQKEEVENYAELETAQTALDAALMTELTRENWMALENGDCYALNPDGTGSHNALSVTFVLGGCGDHHRNPVRRRDPLPMG